MVFARLTAWCGAGLVALSACASSSATLAEASTPATIPAMVASSTSLPPQDSPDVSDPTVPEAAVDVSTTVPDPSVLIIQAVQRFDIEYNACGMSPARCDPSVFTASQGNARSNLVAFYAGMVKKELFFGPGDEPDQVVVSRVDLDGPEHAVAQTCVWSTGIVFGPPGGDGKPTVVNDEKVSVPVAYDVYLEQGRWLVGGETPTGARTVGTNTCAAG